MSPPLPTLAQIDALLSHLPALSEPGRAWVVGGGGAPTADGEAITVAWPEYAEDVSAFFLEAGRSWWCDHDYVPGDARARLEDPEQVATADLASIRTMLTYCVRSERFGDGAWAHHLESGRVQRLLERLRELRAEMVGRGDGERTRIERR